MTKITVSKDKNNPYLVMDKRGLQDTRLSWKAKGILYYNYYLVVVDYPTSGYPTSDNPTSDKH